MKNRNHPSVPVPLQNSEGQWDFTTLTGFTKREAAAFMVLQGLLASGYNGLRKPLCELALKYTDEMFNQLEK